MIIIYTKNVSMDGARLDEIKDDRITTIKLAAVGSCVDLTSCKAC